MTTLVCDVNETLLDLNALNPYFEQIFGDARIKSDWFKQVLQSALISNSLGRSQDTDFGKIAMRALHMIAKRNGVTLTDDHKNTIREGMLNLPPHPDVLPAIERLHSAGIRMAALTNSAQQAAEAQLKNSGIAPYLDKIMSVQSVGKFKPAREVYDFAAQQLSEDATDLWLIAAHDWDIMGARNAGWHGALIMRPTVVVDPEAGDLAPTQQFADLEAFADWWLS